MAPPSLRILTVNDAGGMRRALERDGFVAECLRFIALKRCGRHSRTTVAGRAYVRCHYPRMHAAAGLANVHTAIPAVPSSCLPGAIRPRSDDAESASAYISKNHLEDLPSNDQSAYAGSLKQVCIYGAHGPNRIP